MAVLTDALITCSRCAAPWAEDRSGRPMPWWRAEPYRRSRGESTGDADAREKYLKGWLHDGVALLDGEAGCNEGIS